jgi:long-chain acyl-CoA synthetase
MTETAAITSLTAPGDLTHGQIGLPSPCVEIKLVDIPEMGYTSKDHPNPRGEIWIRGASVFKGYYKDTTCTAEALHDDWMVTGDVGMWDAQGRLFLIDRKKAIFKLSQGEYVAPEKIEAVLCRNSKIAQAFVDGDSLKPFLVAVVVPDKEAVLPWAHETFPTLSSASWEEICSDAQVRTAIMQDIVRLGSKGTNELKGFELPKAIHLEPELFSIDNGMLTPKFSIKRPIAKKKYAQTVKDLYATIKE